MARTGRAPVFTCIASARFIRHSSVLFLAGSGKRVAGLSFGFLKGQFRSISGLTHPLLGDAPLACLVARNALWHGTAPGTVPHSRPWSPVFQLRNSTSHSVCEVARQNKNMFVCMYVCMYVCVYVCIYIYLYIYVCMYVCIYIYRHVCMYVCMCVYIYICMCVCMHVSTYIYISLSIYLSLYICL